MNNKVKELIDYFENNKEHIKKNHNEEQTKIELINPLFECLGWDVNNSQHLADSFKEVKYEVNLKIGSNLKAPDYSFNHGKILFYLEAKKPGVDIKNDIHPAYQLRRYGWTKRLPISILTDFEELAIYDCRIKPNKNDNAGTARVKYYTYTDYINKWDEIYNFISKDAILHGSLNDFENKQIKGTASIDDFFLNFIEDIRKLLALNISLRNTDLTENDFNFAIQMIIDRIMFLRICEDRGIEKYELLKESVSNNNCYEKLIDLFEKADDKYNSGLFHFKIEKDRAEIPDNITSKLKIDDKVLKDIINGLYYPDCPFALDVISSDVLGSVYERFLGKVIRLTSGHHAKIEEKPEVRKAGGVYYTPGYIVEYIVKNTVGELIKDKTLNQISKIKILDPACGSGSFLIEAYKYLLDWHLNYYHNNEPEKWKKGKEPKIFESQAGLQLTLIERKRILLNNIFGVDIDKQAVEVTKLSLLLKVLEYEGLEVQQKLLFNERILPDLYKNIKCGNSLIGTDILNNVTTMDILDIQKIKPFDWDKEFPEVFTNVRTRLIASLPDDGFDVVIGNPPYGAELNEDERTYLENKFNMKNTDTACLFIGHSANLLNNKGINGFIIPKPFVYASNWKMIREKVLNNIIEIVDCGKVWKEVKLEQIIYFIDKSKITDNYKSAIRRNQEIVKIGIIEKSTFKQFGLYLNGISEKELKLGEKILNSAYFLNEVCNNQRGSMYQKEVIETQSDFDVLGGKQIGRYFISDDSKGFISKKVVTDEKAFIKQNSILVQNIVAHIENPTPHIKIISSLSKTINVSKTVILDTINQLEVKKDFSAEVIIAILNSKLTSWYCYRFIFGMAIRTMHFDNAVTSRIPIPNNISKQTHDHLVSLVDQMLETQKKYHSVNTDHEIKLYKQMIDNLDKQIDSLVYQLYGLTEEEIKIVEG